MYSQQDNAVDPTELKDDEDMVQGDSGSDDLDGGG